MMFEAEGETTESESEVLSLERFMVDKDRKTKAWMITFFSVGSSRYLHPRELREFWESLGDWEKWYYRDAMFEMFG